ncbi:lytic transglycosylase domain-containing protein [Homoserinibacter sp. GY 40078]|uniref:lytic transglycosylase domain-containing protein n=1 Tax=Homoserinibacter sp. GY 40078 TaxID=2603275 RepID=UPI0011C7185B|nr:lytic murein transglycosylase [Homoserinibacter sp. GY 40078]TXK18577.1 murein transglycosylase [Homoserinibacter sp. GY 40078]
MRAVLRPLAIVAAVVAGLAVVVVAIAVFLAPRAGGGGIFSEPEPLPSWAPPAEPPVAADPRSGPGITGLADAEWVAEVAAVTGIPEVALAAYAGAAIAKAREMPECGLGWETLAGIGATESDHGRHDGSSLDEGGTAVPPIFGVALDGEGVALVPDSDDGEIDGDPDADRAVGPMQLIPEAWRNWHVDGGGDGVEDPQNVFDAALSAANYLCRASTAFDTEDGWRAGIRSYNAPEVYLGTVAQYAIRYTEDAAEALASPSS